MCTWQMWRFSLQKSCRELWPSSMQRLRNNSPSPWEAATRQRPPRSPPPRGWRSRPCGSPPTISTPGSPAQHGRECRPRGGGLLGIARWECWRVRTTSQLASWRCFRSRSSSTATTRWSVLSFPSLPHVCSFPCVDSRFASQVGSVHKTFVLAYSCLAIVLN